jgi:two-component system sensor histidine kinase VanS
LVQILVRARGTNVAVQVRNTGPVVSADQTEQLCEPFRRGTDRTYSRDRGHGLGLSIIHSITIAHEGRMEIHPIPTGA